MWDTKLLEEVVHDNCIIPVIVFFFEGCNSSVI